MTEYSGLLSLCFLLVAGFVGTEGEVTLVQKLEPYSGRVLVGDDCVVTCSTNADIRNRSVIWWRWQDSLRYQIGVDSEINKDFVNHESTQRYVLSGILNNNSTFRIYTLKITNAQPEDSADIECVLSPGNESAKGSVAVCDEKESSECSCMQSSSWASPKCFKDVEDSSDSLATDASMYRRATIGLAVSVGILLLYSLAMCVLLRRESTEEKELRRSKREERAMMIVTPTQQQVSSERSMESLSRDVSDAASSSTSSGDTNNEKKPADYVIRRNVAPGNSRVSGRRAEKSGVSEHKSLNSSGFINDAYIPDVSPSHSGQQQQQQQQKQQPYTPYPDFSNQGKGKKLIKDENSRKSSHKNKQINGNTNLGQNSGNLSQRDQNLGQSSGIETQRHQSSTSEMNNLTNRGRSVGDLSNSENRTASYTSTSATSAASLPPTYEQSMHDTMI